MESSEKEALRWYCKAAVQGYAEAQYKIGMLIVYCIEVYL